MHSFQGKLRARVSEENCAIGTFLGYFFFLHSDISNKRILKCPLKVPKTQFSSDTQSFSNQFCLKKGTSDYCLSLTQKLQSEPSEPVKIIIKKDKALVRL